MCAGDREKNAAGERVVGRVGEIDGSVEVRDREGGEDRTELLVAGEPGSRVDAGDDDRPDEVTVIGHVGPTKSDHSALAEPVRKRRAACACASASMTGPSWLPESRVGPMTSERAASTTRSTTASWTLSTQMRRLAAEHFCPEKPNAEETTAGTTSSRSASLSTMMAFLPPSSAMTLTIERRRSSRLAAVSTMRESDIARAGEGDQIDPRV